MIVRVKPLAFVVFVTAMVDGLNSSAAAVAAGGNSDSISLERKITGITKKNDAAAAAAANKIMRRRTVDDYHISPSFPVNFLHPLRVRGGGRAAKNTAATTNASMKSTYADTGADAISNNQHQQLLKSRTINALHLTSFLIVASTSMVVFSPLPSLTKHLADGIISSSTSSTSSPQARAVQILSLLSAISASIELFLSPLVGIFIDNFGRKVPTVIFLSMIACANLGVVLHPGVWSICISRMVNVVIGGFMMIVANAVIADLFAGRGEMMGSVLGRQAASVSLGFLFGSVTGGRLTEYGERPAYGAGLLFSVLATFNVSFRMFDSLQLSRISTDASSANAPAVAEEDTSDKRPASIATIWKEIIEAPLSSIQLLFHYGSHMRMLALLLMLQSAPSFMGDVFQMFAKEEWGLQPKNFANIVAIFGVLGIVSNMSLPLVLQSFGLRNFSLFAILSSMLFPISILLTDSGRAVLLAGCIGLYGGTQKVGTTAAMTSLANEMGVRQGRLQGEKASMLALLKIACPVLYSMLYLRGKAWSEASSNNMMVGSDIVGLEMIMGKVGRKLPFLLNICLGICALAVTWKIL